jgi:NitT/TauT family transport system substrate-binding protein
MSGEIKMKSLARWLCALGALASVSAGARAQEVVVKVGIAKALATAATMIAVEKGYFREAGVKVEVSELDSAANAMALLAQGQFNIVEGGISVGFFNAIERGLPVGIVADRVSTPLNHKLLIRADLKDKIKSPADLKGRVIASNGPGAVTTYEIAKILKSGGLSIDDIDIKVLSFVQMGVALTNKAVDAALVIPPWGYQYVDQGVASILADPDDYADPKPLTIAVNLINTEWAAKNEAMLRGYFTAYQRAARDYCQAYHGGANRAEVIDILIKTGMESRRDIIEKFPWPARNVNGRINMTSVMDMQNYYVGQKLATKEFPAERIFDSRFVDYANDKLGPFEVENKASTLAGCR